MQPGETTLLVVPQVALELVGIRRQLQTAFIVELSQHCRQSVVAIKVHLQPIVFPSRQSHEVQQAHFGVFRLLLLPEVQHLLHLLSIQLHPLTTKLHQGAFRLHQLPPLLFTHRLVANS